MTIENVGARCGAVDYHRLAKRLIAQGDAYYQKHLDIHQPFNTLGLALDEYYQALELTPDCPELLAKVSRVFLRQGEIAKAMAMASKALSFDPNTPEAHYVKGYVLYKQGQFKASVEHLGKSIQFGSFGASRYRFAQFYSQWAFSKECHALLNVTLKCQAMGSLLSGFMSSLKDPEPSQVHHLLRIFPKLLWGFGLEEKQESEKALAIYHGLYERYLGMAPLMCSVGSVYQKLGDPAMALEWFQRAEKRDALSEGPYYALAQVYEELGDFDGMVASLEKLLRLRPADPEVHCSLANAYALKNQFDLATCHYKSALKLSKNKEWRSLVAHTLGSLYMDVHKNLEAAQNAFELAIELNPKEVQHYIHLGIAHFESGDFHNAERVYQQALKRCESHHKVYSNLGYLKWMNGDVDDAIDLYHQAIALAPDYAIPYNNMGVIYLDALFKVDEAASLMEQAIALNPAYALAHYNLGRAYTLQGRKLEAAQCFHQAQQLNLFTRDLDNDELNERLNSLFNSLET
jgi:tetratricopeptide (TPR) repeat protein